MVVASIVITTIVVFLLVDFALRMLLQHLRESRSRRERELALDTGLRMDVSAEAASLRRVEVDEPLARILAVDDEKIVLDSFRKMLVLAGYSIDTVESGPEALGLIRHHDYDFVFTDLKMPGMDGVEVTQAVRHLRPDIDVIVITGYGSIDTAVETIRFGAMDYVQKPFTEDELLEFVRTALIRRQDRIEKQMRHKVRLVGAGTRESRSKFDLNVPAGVFVSPQHAWAKIEMNGIVRVGLDDLIRKVFPGVQGVALPEPGMEINRGETLFTLNYGDYQLAVSAPVSGTVTRVNSEHTEHPEWLAVKPFELSWMCCIEPSNLAGELADLRIGTDSVTWYQQEVDRYSELANRVLPESEDPDNADSQEGGSGHQPETTDLLASFAEPFLKG